MKNNWTKPQLQIFTRGKQEEAVLDTCKNNVMPTEGLYSSGNYRCDYKDPACQLTNCDAIASS